MREAQHEDGCVPTIAPQYTSFKPPWAVFNDSPEWGSAIVLLRGTPISVRQTVKSSTTNYAAMSRYVATSHARR